VKIDLLVITFVLIAWTGVKAMMLNADEPESVTFPEFDAPDIEFNDLPDSCGGFTDCIEFVGNIIVNLVLGVVFVVLFLLALIIFVIEFVALLATIGFEPLDGAPAFVNVLLAVPTAAGIAIILYRMLRKGDTNAA
jgi:hypothetical protein